MRLTILVIGLHLSIYLYMANLHSRYLAVSNNNITVVTVIIFCTAWYVPRRNTQSVLLGFRRLQENQSMRHYSDCLFELIKALCIFRWVLYCAFLRLKKTANNDWICFCNTDPHGVSNTIFLLGYPFPISSGTNKCCWSSPIQEHCYLWHTLRSIFQKPLQATKWIWRWPPQKLILCSPQKLILCSQHASP